MDLVKGACWYYRFAKREFACCFSLVLKSVKWKIAFSLISFTCCADLPVAQFSIFITINQNSSLETF